MAVGISGTTAGSMLSLLITQPTSQYIQLHTGDPGSAGTTDPSSVTTRVAATWSSVTTSGGTIVTVSTTNEPEWTNWAGTSPETDTDISFWNNATAGDGVFNMSMQLSSSVTMNTGDSLTLTSITVSIPIAS